MTIASSNFFSDELFTLFPKYTVRFTPGRFTCSFKLSLRSFFCTAAYTCSALPVPSNGIKFGCPENATVYNDTVCQFSCNDGYIGSGSQARRCQHNGTWSGQDFTCQGRYYKLPNKIFKDKNFMPLYFIKQSVK